MTAPCILIAMVGRTDLRVLAERVTGNGETEYGVLEIDKNEGRRFHEALINKSFSYRLKGEDELTPLLCTDNERTSVRLDGNGPALREPRDKPPSGWALVHEEGALVLIATKLAAVSAELKESGKDVRAVLLLSTRRTMPVVVDKKDFTKEEPVAAAPLLAAWLATRLGLKAAEAEGEIGDGLCGWVDFLIGDETPVGTGRDYPHRRVAVDRMDGAIRRLRAAFPSAPVNPLALTSTGGGFPEFKEILRASARLHFGSVKCRDLFEPEGGRKGRRTPEWLEFTPTATDSLRLRQHAIDLIRRGDFTGAHASVSELENDPVDRRWVAVLAYVAAFFQGMPLPSLPTDSPRPAALAILDKPGSRSLALALRVEAALWSGRLNEAIIATMTFLDVATTDHLRRLSWVTKAPFDDDWIEVGSEDAIPTDQVVIVGKFESGDTQRAQLEKSGHASNRYCFKMFREQAEKWRNVLKQDDRFAPLDGIVEAYNKETKASGKMLRMSSIRNIIAHRAPTAKLIEDAGVVFQRAGLWAQWSDDETRVMPGQPWQPRFLAQPLIVAALQPLLPTGVADPADHYRDLLNDLPDLLLIHRIG